MKEIAFENGIVKNHWLYPSWGTTLSNKCRDDYGGKNYFNEDIISLDMDRYEKDQHKAQTGSTVDAVIGVEEFHKDHFSNSRQMFVELKLDVKSSKTLGKSECDKKVKGTLGILRDDHQIYPIVFFVFTDKIAPQMKSRFDNWNRGSHPSLRLESVSVEQFNNAVKPKSAFPIQIMNNPREVLNDMVSYISIGDIQGFWLRKEFWYNKALTYRKNHKCEEARSIMECILKAIETLLVSPFFIKSDRLYVEDQKRIISRVIGDNNK